MSDNIEIFEGKTFQDLTKDIYENSQKKKLQIDLLIQEIHGMIQRLDDAVMVAPLIKELFDVDFQDYLIISNDTEHHYSAFREIKRIGFNG